LAIVNYFKPKEACSDTPTPEFDELLDSQYYFSIFTLFPALEEMIFRGLIQQSTRYILTELNLPEELAQTSAILFSSILFGLAHKGQITVKKTFFSGLLYGTLTALNEGSLYSSTFAHMTNNGLCVMILKYLKEKQKKKDFDNRLRV
jgi:membrane protease YdiL (CAAX protease family)